MGQLRKMMNRLMLAFTLCVFALGASAQGFPSKPIRIIIPFGGGGIADIIARSMAEDMSKTLGQPVIVESRPGASGLVAYQYVASQPADGYTLALGDSGVTVLPLFVKNVGLDLLRDVPAFSIVADSALMLATSKSSGWKSYADMVRYAKANPGKVNIGLFGLQNAAALNTEVLKQKDGLNIVAIPYKGGAAEVRLALTGGHVNLAWYTDGLRVADVDKVNILAVSGKERLPSIPDVPTFEELGIAQVDGMFITLNAPAGTPEAVLERLSAAAKAALHTPQSLQRLANVGMVAMGTSREATRKRITELARANADIAHKAGIKPE